LEIAESEAFTFQEPGTPAQTPTSVSAEVLDFLIKRPTPSQIVAFKVSPPTQERLRTLLAKNREGTLTVQEKGELDVYEQLEHLMILLKAHAIKAIP
jgi:arsenate reductase-like glutaredoxin family protein